VDRMLTSPVRIDLEGVPLRTSLRLIAEQLRLAYYVSEGNVIISSPKIIQQTADKEESQQKKRADKEESRQKSKKDQAPTDREK
jgi:hypothetical protein